MTTLAASAGAALAPRASAGTSATCAGKLAGPAAFLRELIEQGGPEPDAYDELDACYRGIMDLVRRDEIAATDLAMLWPTLGGPFTTTDTMQGFGIVKPHGYAGDFEMIDRIYQERLSPDPRHQRWDLYFHSRNASRAVRNRKRYFLALLDRMRAQRPGADLAVLSVGSGPARECREYLERDRAAGRVTFHCVDLDPNAIEYARALNGGFEQLVRFEHGNALRYTTDRKFDLVWSAGLFDYLGDDLFKRLLRRLFRFVKPGGELAVGNFAPHNPTRDFMEFGHWFLKHRDEAELRALADFDGTDIAPALVRVDGEPERINLFLHVDKPVDAA